MKQNTNANLRKNKPAAVCQHRQNNIVGAAGFAFSASAFLLMQIHMLNIILCGLGLILSIAGLFNKPRGFAIAGLVISIIFLGLFLP